MTSIQPNRELVSRARVIAVEGAVARVEACTGQTCENCPGGCNWGGWRGPRRLSLSLPPEIFARVGDWLWLGIGRSALLSAAAWVYGAPLVGLLGGALLGARLDSEGAAAALSLLGLAGGWLVARLRVSLVWAADRIRVYAERPPLAGR